MIKYNTIKQLVFTKLRNLYDILRMQIATVCMCQWSRQMKVIALLPFLPTRKHLLIYTGNQIYMSSGAKTQTQFFWNVSPKPLNIMQSIYIAFSIIFIKNMCSSRRLGEKYFKTKLYSLTRSIFSFVLLAFDCVRFLLFCVNFLLS